MLLIFLNDIILTNPKNRVYKFAYAFTAVIRENFCVNIYKQNLCLFEITDNLSKYISDSENRLKQVCHPVARKR